VNKPALSDIFTPEVSEFVEAFYRVGITGDFPWIFLISGGALAVENALKAAFDWKVRKNLAAGRDPGGSRILHFKECFHGRSGYTMSLTDSPDPRKTMYYPQFDWPRVHNPKLRFPLTPQILADVEASEARSVREIEAAFAAHPHDIAGIIIEPIQGEGGDNHFRPEFFAQLRRLADEHDALLIFDEIQTGIGATGRFWCHEYMKVIHDIVVWGKKTQVCGIHAGPRINEVERNVFVESSRINSTFGGNLVDLVRFTKVLEVIERDGLVARTADTGAYFKERLEALAQQYPDVLTNVRGRGTFLAVDLPNGEARDEAHRTCMSSGLMMLTCGPRSLRFRPALTFTREEVDEAMELFAEGIRAAAERITKAS
jgi:L-lysine 6-transaminase